MERRLVHMHQNGSRKSIIGVPLQKAPCQSRNLGRCINMRTNYPHKETTLLQCRNETSTVWLGFHQMHGCLYLQGISQLSCSDIRHRWQFDYIFDPQLGGCRVVSSSHILCHLFLMFQSSLVIQDLTFQVCHRDGPNVELESESYKDTWQDKVE